VVRQQPRRRHREAGAAGLIRGPVPALHRCASRLSAPRRIILVSPGGFLPGVPSGRLPVPEQYQPAAACPAGCSPRARGTWRFETIWIIESLESLTLSASAGKVRARSAGHAGGRHRAVLCRCARSRTGGGARLALRPRHLSNRTRSASARTVALGHNRSFAAGEFQPTAIYNLLKSPNPACRRHGQFQIKVCYALNAKIPF
jgi:hypothetical protein